jgi:hypothetical protein
MAMLASSAVARRTIAQAIASDAKTVNRGSRVRLTCARLRAVVRAGRL